MSVAASHSAPLARPAERIACARPYWNPYLAGAFLGWFAGGFYLTDRNLILMTHRWLGTAITIFGIVLALMAVFLDVGMRAGVPPALMAFGLLFASSYFSTITPQGGSQNVIFVGSGYLQQRELYRLGALTTGACFLVFMLVGTPWILFVTR